MPFAVFAARLKPCPFKTEKPPKVPTVWPESSIQVEFATEDGGEVALEGGCVKRFAVEIFLHGSEGIGSWGVNALDEGASVALAGVEDGLRGYAIDGDHVIAVDDDGGEGINGLRFVAGVGFGAGGFGGGSDEEDGEIFVGGALESVGPFIRRNEGLHGEGDHECRGFFLVLEECEAACAFKLFDDGDSGTDGAESGVTPVCWGNSVCAAEVDGDPDRGGFAAEARSKEA
jgi:hypothetical protein